MSGLEKVMNGRLHSEPIEGYLSHWLCSLV